MSRLNYILNLAEQQLWHCTKIANYAKMFDVLRYLICNSLDCLKDIYTVL